MDKTSHKLTNEQQDYVCSLLAIGYNPEIVVQELEDEFGITVTRHNIRFNYLKNPKWHDKIERYRDKSETAYLKEPLAKKLNRIKVLTKALQECISWRTDKLYYDKDGNYNGKVVKRQIGCVASLIEQVRKEVGQDKGSGHSGLTLIQIINNAVKGGNGKHRPDTRDTSRVDELVPRETPSVDEQDTGDLVIV